MALWDRLFRLLSNFGQQQLDPRILAGVQGEEYATEIIRSTNPHCHVPNAIAPSVHPGGWVCETDHIVLSEGTIFVVEVKNYKGRLLWADDKRSNLLQIKSGRYGESIAPKRLKNPAHQARGFVHPAKQYLARACDRRFEHLRIEAVGAFTRNGDISAIHSFEDGLVYVDELPALFSMRRNERFANRPSEWIVTGLEALPRLDVVRTAEGHHFRGFLQGSHLQYRGPEQQEYGWEWRQIEWIYLERSGVFSSHDKVILQLRSGRRVESQAVQGIVRVLDLEGQLSEHKLSNLAFIAPSPSRDLLRPAI